MAVVSATFSVGFRILCSRTGDASSEGGSGLDGGLSVKVSSRDMVESGGRLLKNEGHETRTVNCDCTVLNVFKYARGTRYGAVRGLYGKTYGARVPSSNWSMRPQYAFT